MAFKRSYLLLSIGMFSSLLGAPTWQGLFSSDWTDSTNWATPAIVPGAGDTPIFNSASAATLTVDYTALGGPSPAFAGMTLTAGVPSFVISGTSPAALTFLNNALITDTGSHTINGSIIINTLLRITENSASSDLTINANISEAVPNSGLNIIGPAGANVFLTGAGSSYTGTTQITTANLGITQDSALGVGGILSMSSGTTLKALDSNVEINTHPVFIGISVQFDTVNIANVMTINTAVSGNSLIKISPGTLVLTGSNAFANGITVSGGILKGNTTSLAADILNNAAVIFDQPGDQTYGFDMSGSGSLTKEGAGTLTLVGTNTYAGGTTITAGALQGNTVSFPVGKNIVNNTTVIFNQSFNGIFSGVISGSGNLIKNNIGTLTLTASNNYAGGTIVNGGTLEVSVDNNLGASGSNLTLNAGTTLKSGMPLAVLSNHPVILGGGIATINATNSLNINSNISGPGGLSITGILALNGANTYSGGTTLINASLLGCDTDSLPGNIVNNGLVFFTQSFNGTYAGVMSGSGLLQKNGTGTLNLTNTNTYLGNTNVLVGTLAVNGSIAGSGVTVSHGATLAGTGTIHAPVTVNGRLSPGNSIGTMTSFAQVTFNSGASFEVEISPTASDLLNVVGAGVTINSGATLNLTADPGTYSPSASYTLIHTTGGIGGTFGTLKTNSAFLHPILTYTANDLLLTLARIDFTDVLGTGGNVGAVAACLDNSQAPDGSDMSNIIFSLMTFTDMNALRKAINQLQPSLYTGYALSQENMSLRMRSMITKRAGSLSQNNCLKSDCIDRGWTLWIDGLGDWSRQQNHHHQNGYHTTSGAGALGADYQVTTNFYLGLSGAYSATDINWNGHTANGDIQSYYGTVYGTWSTDHFFIDGAVMGAHNKYTGKRHIKFANVNRHAHNNHAGNEVLAHLNLGGLFQANCLAINPFVSVDYIFLHQNGFKEHGANSLNLRVKKTRSNYVRGEAGLNFNSCFERENSRWVPQLKLGVIQEWRPNGKHYSSRLEGIDCNFRTKGLSPNRTLFAPGASLTALFCCNRLSVELAYDTELGSHYWDQNVNLQLGYSF